MERYRMVFCGDDDGRYMSSSRRHRKGVNQGVTCPNVDLLACSVAPLSGTLLLLSFSVLVIVAHSSTTIA